MSQIYHSNARTNSHTRSIMQQSDLYPQGVAPQMLSWQVSTMSILKQQPNIKPEIFKALLYLMLGVMTGITSIAYSVLIHKIPAYMILVGAIGIVVIFIIGMYELKIWNKMQELNKEMRDAK